MHHNGKVDAAWPLFLLLMVTRTSRHWNTRVLQLDPSATAYFTQEHKSQRLHVCKAKHDHYQERTLTQDKKIERHLTRAGSINAPTKAVLYNMKRPPTLPPAAVPLSLSHRRHRHVSPLLLTCLLLALVSLLPATDALVLCRNDRLEPAGACAARYAPIAASVRTELSGQLPVIPLVVRLAWHSAGTYGAGLSPPGGTSGGCLRHVPESAHRENRGLQPAVRVVMLLVASHPTVTFADMTQLAAAVGHELLGSGDMYFTPGRPDYSESVARSRCTSGRLAGFDKAPGDVFPYPLTATRVLDSFSRLLAEEKVAQWTVALMGAHTLGGVTHDVSGVSASFDATPLTFDNGYYKKILAVDWRAAEVFTAPAFPNTPVFLDNGAANSGSNATALVTDLSLLADPLTRAAVELFAANSTAFFEAYSAAWESISEAGVDRAGGGCDDGGSPTPGSLRIRSRPDLMYDHVRSIDAGGPAIELHSAFQRSGGGKKRGTETTIYIAVVSAAPEGWLSIAFPASAGRMAPAPYAVTHSGEGLEHWTITEDSLEGLVELQPGKRWEAVSEVAHEVVNGRQILSMAWRAVVDDDFMPGFNPSRAFVNVARNPTEAALQSHPPGHATAITVNLTSGQVQITHKGERRLSWRLLHGYLMAAASFFVIPAGVLAKRYGKRVFGLSDASRRNVGLAFALHVALQTLGVLLVIAGYVVADSKLSSRASAAHKKLAAPCLAVLCLSWAFGLAARVECLEALLRRSLRYGRAVKILHAALGITAVVLLVVQCVVGVRSLRAIYPEGDEAWGASTFTYAGAATAATALLFAEAVFRRRRCGNRPALLAESNVTTFSRLPIYTHHEVSLHNTKDDAWFIIEGKVIDVTSFVDSHPGGGEPLLEVAGKDATSAFHVIDHSVPALRVTRSLVVGLVEGSQMRPATELVGALTSHLCELDIAAASKLLQSVSHSHRVPRTLLLELTGLVHVISCLIAFLPPAAASGIGNGCLGGDVPGGGGRYVSEGEATEAAEEDVEYSENSIGSASVPVAAATVAASSSPTPAGKFMSSQPDVESAPLTLPLTYPIERDAERRVAVLSVRPDARESAAADPRSIERFFAVVQRHADQTGGCLHRIEEDCVTVSWGAMPGPTDARSGRAAPAGGEKTSVQALRTAVALAMCGNSCGVVYGEALCCCVSGRYGKAFQLRGGLVQQAALLSWLARAANAGCVAGASLFHSLGAHEQLFAHCPFFDVVHRQGGPHAAMLKTRVVLGCPARHQAMGAKRGETLASLLLMLFQGEHPDEVACGLEKVARRDGPVEGFPTAPAFILWLQDLLEGLVEVPALDVTLSGAVYPQAVSAQADLSECSGGGPGGVGRAVMPRNPSLVVTRSAAIGDVSAPTSVLCVRGATDAGGLSLSQLSIG